MRVGIEASAMTNMAGSGVVTRHLVKELNSLGHTVVLLSKNSNGEAKKPRRRGFQRLLYGMDQVVWTQLGLARAADAAEVDVLVCPGYIGPVLSSRPVVLFIYDLGFLFEPALADRLFGFYLRRLVPLLIKRADRIIVISQATLDDLRRRFPKAAARATIALLGPGDADSMLKAPAHVAPSGQRRPYVLMVGTIEPRKNYVRAIQAFDLFRKDAGQDWLMVIVGSRGWGHEAILEIPQRLGLDDAVVFMGRVSEVELSDLYRQAGALFFPSLKEGFGLPILEAMTLECPVITSKLSSMAEVADGAAELVDPLDVHSMAGALRAVLCDETRRLELIRQGRHRVEGFSWGSFGLAVEQSLLAEVERRH